MKKILIVDNYPDILEGLSYVLKDHYEVTTAGNLTEAKKEVSTTVFDVICSDYAMPDGTGLALNFADRKSLLCLHDPFQTGEILRGTAAAWADA